MSPLHGTIGGVAPADWQLAAQVLFQEAEILDAGEISEWLTLLSPAIQYRVMLRIQRTRPERQMSHDRDSFIMACDYDALKARVVRQSSEFAWSEETPPATRRFIANIRVERAESAMRVRSNLLVFRAKWDNVGFLCAERKDRWSLDSDHPLLAERLVYLDQTVVPVDNLGIFL